MIAMTWPHRQRRRHARVLPGDRPVRVLEMLGYPGGLELLCYTPEEFEMRREELGLVQVACTEGFELPRA